MKKLFDVLIIDDEEDIAEILQEILSPHYANIEVCTDSEKAKTILNEKNFKIILSDVNMPKLDGHELLRHLRSEGNLTPVILITGKATKSSVISAMRLGVSDLIEKPFDADQLVQSVQRVLQIEKRYVQYYVKKAQENLDPKDLDHQGKMIGLLQVANDVKKSAS